MLSKGCKVGVNYFFPWFGVLGMEGKGNSFKCTSVQLHVGPVNSRDGYLWVRATAYSNVKYLKFEIYKETTISRICSGLSLSRFILKHVDLGNEIF